jgi:hypothetical protein
VKRDMCHVRNEVMGYGRSMAEVERAHIYTMCDLGIERKWDLYCTMYKKEFL